MSTKQDEILPFMTDKYMNEGPLPNASNGNFQLTRDGPPLKEELTNEQFMKILQWKDYEGHTTDLEVNTLVWKCLGYRFEDGRWNDQGCFPKWREKYPVPPDFIGMQRIYSKEVDNPSLRANQALCKTIPLSNKQSLKEHLREYGFTGFKLDQLTPNKTRRAQCANWLLYYRENLYGYTVEELKERREREQEEEKRKEKEDGTEGEWKPPFKPVV